MSSTLLNTPVPCSRCGYDLRGTAVGGVCPECGLGVLATRQGLWVDGTRLVVRSGQVLPARCVKTNQPVESRPITKQLYWVHPALWLLVLINWVALLIVYLIVRKPCQITFCLSDEARWRKRWGVLVGFCSFMLGFVPVVGGAMYESGIAMVVGVLICIAGIGAMLVYGNTLSIARHRDGEFWIKGCGLGFLASLEARDDRSL